MGLAPGGCGIDASCLLLAKKFVSISLQADARQVKRAMEKENKKERDSARKQYNQDIRVSSDWFEEASEWHNTVIATGICDVCAQARSENPGLPGSISTLPYKM